MVPWKMLIGPGLLLGMKLVKVDYQSPENLLIIRVLYGCSQALLLVLCSYIAYGIREYGDEKMFVNPKPKASGEQPTESPVTVKEYDTKELVKLAKNFALGAAVTIGIHVYLQVVPALLLQIVTQPITLAEHPLFAIYVLKKDPSKDSNLTRPFPDNSPTAKMDAMKQEAIRKRQENSEQEQAGGEARMIGSETVVEKKDTSKDVAVGGDANTSLSTAERRHTRHESEGLRGD